MFTATTIDDLSIQIPKNVVDDSEFLSTLFSANDHAFIPLAYTLLKDTIDAHAAIASIGDQWESSTSRRTIVPTFPSHTLSSAFNIAKVAHYLCLDRLCSFTLFYSANLMGPSGPSGPSGV